MFFISEVFLCENGIKYIAVENTAEGEWRHGRIFAWVYDRRYGRCCGNVPDAGGISRRPREGAVRNDPGGVSSAGVIIAYRKTEKQEGGEIRILSDLPP